MAYLIELLKECNVYFFSVKCMLFGKIYCRMEGVLLLLGKKGTFYLSSSTGPQFL